MTSSILIRSEPGRRLFFEVVNERSEAVASSVCYNSICRLEATLTTLRHAATNSTDIAVERNTKVTRLGSASRRSRVAFVGELDAIVTDSLLLAASTATLVDLRPPGRRHTHLAGRLCDLNF